jgi:hypothetical protein
VLSDDFRIARDPGVSEIGSHKPTSRYRFAYTNRDYIQFADHPPRTWQNSKPLTTYP